MKELLKNIYVNAKQKDIDRFADHINFAMIRYEIFGYNRQRVFLAQIGHESAELSAVVENLNYSASGLRKVFPKYFPTDNDAIVAQRNPQEIANIVYANRLGNGDKESGDGWNYRGRGLIQITGKANYKRITELMYGMALGIDFVDMPYLLEEPQFAAESAACWWKNAGLNELSDQLSYEDETETFKKITNKINGGLNGLDHRLELYERAKQYI